MLNREQLGELVRLAWIEWALEQPDPKLSWLVPWAELSEADKEADRRIGEFVANILLKQYHPLDLYQQEAQRTVGTKGYGETLAMASMGLHGESGECVELLKKHLFHGHELNRDEITEELGDTIWYLTVLCSTLEISLIEAIAANVKKLRERYPSGFDAERSRNREIEKKR